jgi:hypothetical protein
MCRFGLAVCLAGGLLSACVADTALKKNPDAMVSAGIKTAENADSIMDMPVLFYVTNNGAEAVELLIWNTPLEEVLSADVFAVSRDDQAVSYIGRTMKRSSPEADDYVTIDAGATRETLIDISRYYDTREPGAYEIRFKPLGGSDGYVNNGVGISVDPTAVSVTR